VGHSMRKPDSGQHRPSFTFGHELISRLSAIVGQCDLLKEDLPQYPRCVKRVQLIQDVATSMAEELKRHEFGSTP
jgi:hypothetical protein